MSATKTSARISDRAKPSIPPSGRDTLTALIRKALAGREADPHVIAKRLLPKLPEAIRDDLLLAGLTYRVRQLIFNQRSDTGLPPTSPRKLGPSKWQVSLPIRVTVGDTPKLLDDCDLSDLQQLAADYRERGAQLLERAKDADALAEALGASGCRTVGEMWAAQGTEDLAA